MIAATVCPATVENSDVTTDAAGVTVMNHMLKNANEFMHISRRRRIIAIQSAIAGMVLCGINMVVAARGI